MAGRPRNAEPSEPVTMAAQPKLVEYLDDLIAEQGFGTSRAEVARTLVWERVRELISQGVLDRRRATNQERARVTKRITAVRGR